MSKPLKNIGGSKSDKFFRYTMPELQLKVEKPGTNGQKTIVLNIDVVSKALKVPPEWPTRFFSYELGGQAKFSQAENGGRTAATVMGNHPRDKFEKVLEKFIQLYVLCPTCKLPEIRIKVKGKNGKVQCASCGYNGPLSTGHRLDNFIIKNPPVKQKKNHEMPDEASADKEVSEAVAEEKEAQQQQQAEEPVEDIADAPVVDEDVPGAGGDDEKWSVDTSMAAQQRRREEFEKETKIVASVAPATPEDVIRSMIEKHKDTQDMVVLVASELERLSLVKSYEPKDKLRVLLSGAIDVTQPKTFDKQFTSKAPLLKKVLATLGESSYTDSVLIGSLMSLLVSTPTGEQDLLPRIPIILKSLHEAGVLQAKHILAWADNPPEIDTWAVPRQTAAVARQKADIYVKWLKAAEEEDDEEEEDDD